MSKHTDSNHGRPPGTMLRLMIIAIGILFADVWTARADDQFAVDLPSIESPWTNAYRELPYFNTLIEKLTADVRPDGNRNWLILNAVAKRSTDLPVTMGADFSGQAVLDRLTVEVENRAEVEVKVGIILITDADERISTDFRPLPGETRRTLEYSMLDASPPQTPGTTATVSRIEVALSGVRGNVDYSVAFGRLAFHRLPEVTPIELTAVEFNAQAGDKVHISWPPVAGKLGQDALDVELTVRKDDHAYLDTTTRLVQTGAKIVLEPVELKIPRGMTGGKYELVVDTRRVPIAGQPRREAVVGSVTVEEVRAGEPIRARVAAHNGQPAIHLDGKPHNGLMYMTYHLGGNYVRQVTEAGPDIVSFDTACGYHPYGLTSTTWPEPDVYDFSECDAHAARVLAAAPDAKLLIRCYIACPGWWADANPDELVTVMSLDGVRTPFEGVRGYRPGSWASEKWRQDLGRVYARFVQHLRQAPYSDRVIGVMPCAGVTEEWMMFGSNSAKPTDYSKPTAAAFKRWIKTRYQTDGRLQSAWADAAVSLETVEPPTPKEMAGLYRGGFVDLPRGERACDWWRFLSDVTAETIEHFARIVKRESDGDWLAGTFYGYVLQFNGPRFVTCGHLAIDRLVRSPYLDYFFSPALYSHRSLKPGGYSTFMSTVDTYHLHGKLWCNENDLRTFRVLDVPNVKANQVDRRQTRQETVALFRRELGNVLTHGSAQSYFDMRGGWYDDPGLLAEIGRETIAAQEALGLDRSSAAEIAVVIDPDGFTRQTPTTTANTWLILGQIASLGNMGTPFDVITLADMNALGKRKLWIFLNLFAPSDRRIEQIHRRMQEDGATAVFVYAAGLLSPNDGMRRLTGMTIEAEWERRIVDVTVSPDKLGIPHEETYGTSSPIGPAHYGIGSIGPTFAVEDPAAQVLGIDPKSGRPGLCVKKMDGWTSIYSSAPGLSAAVLRALAKRADVHVYVDQDSVVYANKSVLSVTVVEPGVREIHLRQPATLKDALSGQVLGTGATRVRVPFGERESRLFFLVPE